MYIPSIIWTILYIIVGLWLSMRVLALILQFVIKRKTGILVRIARTGFGAFHNIHITIREGLQVEIDKVWLSSCYVNEEIRQPVVLCMGEVRIQANTDGSHDRKKKTAPHPSSVPSKQFALPKFAAYLQHFGLKIQSLTVMLLKTMVADCLIHIEGNELGLDISCIEDSLQFIINAGSVNSKALKSVSQTNAEAEGQHLAEMSFSLYVDLSVYRDNIKRVKGSRLLINKPQVMLTEGLLSGAYNLQENKSSPPQQQQQQQQQQPGADTSTSKPEYNLKEILPQELGVDITEVDIKIVRETKQRSLGVGIKNFHVDMINQTNEDNSHEITCTLLLEDFSTKSQQARFADLLKLEVKSMMSNEEIKMKTLIQNAYFHYHHDEVQYWMLVMAQFSQGKDNQTVNSELSPVENKENDESRLSKLLQERKLTIDTELLNISTSFSTASCPGLVLGVSRVRKHFMLKRSVHEIESGWLPWLESHDMSVEMELDTLYCTQSEAQIPVSELNGNKHFWNHVLYMNILMIKINKLGDELRVQGMEDHLHIEWSSSTISIITSLLLTLSKAKLSAPRRISNAALRPVRKRNRQVHFEHNRRETTLSLLLKFDITNTNIFMCNNYNVGLMLRIDSAGVLYRQNLEITIEGTKLKYMHITDKFTPIARSCELDHPVANLEDIKMNCNVKEKTFNIQLFKKLYFDWSTSCHMCIIQAIEDVKEMNNKIRGEVVGQEPNIPVRKASVEENVGMSVNVMVMTQLTVKLHLSSNHSVTLIGDKVLLALSPHEIVAELPTLNIFCDEEKVFTFERVVIDSLHDHTLKEERKFFKTLTLKTNRLWRVSVDLLSIVFPFNFDFAACFEEFVNFQKWLKLVHKVKKKAFTVDSKLPPDLDIRVKTFKLEIGDDPFEVKLGDNYELMKDEYMESEKRRTVLDQKVQNLKKGYGIIPAHKIDEVYASLAKSSSDIYIQRSRQLYQITPLRTKLFTWSMENLEITAMADTSIHGKDNVITHMKEIDKDSPYPEEPVEYSTLWCRYINVNVKSWTIKFRDFPQLALDVADMALWGRLIGAEIEGAKRAKRSCTVEVAQPWGDQTVQRNLPALKFFHDFSADVDSFEMAHGACWEPVVAQFNLALDLINKPSIDPSRPLPWWDKARLLFHGRLTMTVVRMSWLYHASLDPYNATEIMDWTWTDLILDWTNMNFLLKGDLDIYVRTASKYDDARILKLPNLQFNAKIDWLCLGDPNDHHQVMPCAPDKVPDYSLEEHDSFRAFRSQNFSLSITLETQKSKSSNHPEFEFYASTLKFLDKIKMCLGNVTRPIRRGQVFQNLKIRKPQLSRHYKYAQLSVNFNQFDISYWMSFSMQHGTTLEGNSFMLELKNELTLRPINDGLIHRPDADWSVIYLNCILTGTKIWLCSSQVRHEDELDVSTTGRPVLTSFFLSLSKVSYQRSATKKSDGIMEEDKSESKTPIHNLQVYDLRGSWNNQNRTVLIGLYDSYMKAQSLKRNLSSEALKGFKVEGSGNASSSKSNIKGSNLSIDAQEVATPSPSTKMQTSHAHSMLLKLVAESDSKSVAFTEEPSSTNMDQLQGVAACQTDDVIQKKWLIELHNSQLIVQGCETQGFVIVAAAKAKILSCDHAPIWVRDNQLRSKDTWVGSLDCMQYYATVDPGHEFSDENIPWLSKTHVEDRAEPDLSSLQEMAGSGHSVGGIVNISYSGNDKNQTVQMQRIISRCKCQFFYVNYGEADPSLLQEVPPPPSDDSDMMQRDEGVDTFTLLHHDLNVVTNHLQYSMILDIVNNLLLHVELKKREATEKLQSMRFQLQLSRVEDQKTPILNLQENVRKQTEKFRFYERELFHVIKAREEERKRKSAFIIKDKKCENYIEELDEDREALESKLRQCKERMNILNEELSIRISCFKESQLQVQSTLQTKQTQQAYVIRRNEVCFKFAQWRLTEPDGQVGIADIALRNFVYTKVNRNNDNLESSKVDLGWVKATNLLPNSIYKDVLAPRDPPGRDNNRQMTLRVLCTERPPGRSFLKKVMEFFFPDKNIDNEDQEEEMEGACAAQKTFSRSEKRSSQKKELKRSPSFTATDDIDKMKERAANNNTFLYIKIPEVSLRVSYKGEKEKNIEDVHDFSLILPTLEYHNCIWTWFDLLMAMKNDSKRVLISQAPQEKPAKKTLFGKSTK
ncbi:LOW QUALITY PROTEIN: protein hobbit-like [Ruditapes philippinarum]|uniref:LOW QUALITY PROTEIN: protein hobbit-like n=1 Tax=Ruditapes philippinarum TaxID=129788 RepID=UPI00295BA060|nr:LOW QUALITY PROTEIN: protein hobbit-like [Ruditapes philippinarum]